MSGKKVKNISNEDSSFKKAKLTDDDGLKSKKSSRAGDNFRQMFMPENKDDLNEKDATYALNFYDKVEEVFRNADKKEEFRQFLKILKNFDPQKDRVTDLYFKMENLFMPDHPDLADMFLTFLLPSEASQIGKFFDHFMLTNMANFVNRVNLYFMKQPAQIKKIFACLNELASDVDVNMDKIKAKILPLLKGNQYLSEWFLQIFPNERPPETLISEYETIDLKQTDLNPNPEEVYETISCKDLIEDSPDHNPCQIKYINGRIFYGTKILLPAKVSFLAKPDLPDNLKEIKSPDNRLIEHSNFCVHELREFAEKKLKSVVDNHQEFTSKEIEVEKEEVINSPKYILCDDQTFKSHAIRLNPSLYSRNTYHHSDSTHKSKLFDSDKDGKMSPKKLFTKIGLQSKERRKSPKKCLPKSPTGKSIINSQTTSLVASTSQAVLTAKKLKSIVEESSNDDSSRNKIKRKPQKSHPKKTTSGSSATGQESDTVSKQDLESEIPPPVMAEPDKPLTWTRDEDKIILEEVQLGFVNEEALISKLASLLPNRTRLQIVQRHRFLMDVLTQLQNKG